MHRSHTGESTPWLQMTWNLSLSAIGKSEAEETALTDVSTLVYLFQQLLPHWLSSALQCYRKEGHLDLAHSGEPVYWKPEQCQGIASMSVDTKGIETEHRS
jgi:hypothetical protein